MKKNIHRMMAVTMLLYFSLQLVAQQTEWPAIRTEMKPGARWWWMGSAVDSINLAYNLKQYAQAGMGTMEITPIYGVQHHEAYDIGWKCTVTPGNRPKRTVCR